MGVVKNLRPVNFENFGVMNSHKYREKFMRVAEGLSRRRGPWC